MITGRRSSANQVRGFDPDDRNALDPGIAIIRVDVPGVGGSPVRVWPYGFPELARLLAVLLDDLGYPAGRRPGLPLGVVRWPSSSPFSTAAGAAGWC